MRTGRVAFLKHNLADVEILRPNVALIEQYTGARKNSQCHLLVPGEREMTNYTHQPQSPNRPRVPNVAIDRSAYRFASANKSSAKSGRPVQQQPVQPPSRSRPRGRLLIVGLMFLVCAIGVSTVWESVLRYQAYGVVTGRIVKVSSPVDGVVTSLHVREGEAVRQSDRLAIVRNLKNEHELARIADELRIAQATLQAETAKMRWQTHVQDTETTRAIADVFEANSQLHDVTGRLDILTEQVEISKDLFNDGHLRSDSLNQRLAAKRATSAMAEEIRKSVEVLSKRAEKARSIPRPGPEQMEPLVAKCNLLLNDLDRLGEQIREGDLRSPVNGQVLKRFVPTGQAIKNNEPLYSVLEDASIEVEMYIPQEMSDQFKAGDTIRVKIEPHTELVACRVISVGHEHRKPPEHIEVFYRKAVHLLPVRMTPIGKFADRKYLPVGAVAKLPYIGSRS